MQMARIEGADVLQRHNGVAAGWQMVLLTAVAVPYITEEALVGKVLSGKDVGHLVYASKVGFTLLMSLQLDA